MTSSDNLEISNAFEVFFDLKGDPLENGRLYIGETGLDPKSNPVSVYWDSDFTIPASQPIRTLAGYPSYNGSPGNLFVNASSYSITSETKNEELIYTRLDVKNLTVAEYAVTVNTYADLLLVDVTEFVSVSVLGFYTAGDGGDGEFYWNAAGNKNTHNGGSIVDPAIGQTPGSALWWTAGAGIGVWERVSLGTTTSRTFGAKGDDVTDDILALQALMDWSNTSGRPAYLVEGTYKTSTELKYYLSSSLIGEGTTKSIIKSYHSGNTLGPDDPDGLGIGMLFENFALTNNDQVAAYVGVGLYLSKIRSSRFYNLDIQWCDIGIKFIPEDGTNVNYSYYNTFEDVDITHCTSNCVKLDATGTDYPNANFFVRGEWRDAAVGLLVNQGGSLCFDSISIEGCTTDWGQINGGGSARFINPRLENSSGSPFAADHGLVFNTKNCFVIGGTAGKGQVVPYISTVSTENTEVVGLRNSDDSAGEDSEESMGGMGLIVPVDQSAAKYPISGIGRVQNLLARSNRLNTADWIVGGTIARSTYASGGPFNDRFNVLAFDQTGGTTPTLTQTLDGTIDTVAVPAANKFTITGVTKANPAVVTVSANHELKYGDQIKISGSDMAELNGNTYFIDPGAASAYDTTFSLRGVDSSAYAAVGTNGLVTQVKTDFVFSIEIKADKVGRTRLRIYNESGAVETSTIWVPVSTEWRKFWVKKTFTDAAGGNVVVQLANPNSNETLDTIQVANTQLEKDVDSPGVRYVQLNGSLGVEWVNSNDGIVVDATWEGVATKVVAAAIDDTDFTYERDGLIGIDSSNGRIYYRYGGAWHYSSQDAGFQINNSDAFDHLVDESARFEEGDIVLGIVNGFATDGAPHCEYTTLETALKKLGIIPPGHVKLTNEAIKKWEPKKYTETE